MPVNTDQINKYNTLETHAKIFLELLDEIPHTDNWELVRLKIKEATFWLHECKKEDIWVDPK